MRELAIAIQSLGLGQHAHTDYNITLAGLASTGWFDVTPSAPFEATILYCVTFAGVLPNVFSLTTLHRGYTLGVKTIGMDEIRHGTHMWLPLTAREPNTCKVDNLDTLTHTLALTIWHLNVMYTKQLDIIKLICWEHYAPGVLPLAKKLGFIPEFDRLVEFEDYLKARYP